jgi:hypothetical protein
MSSTFRITIPSSPTGIRLVCGRDSILGGASEAHTFLSVLVLASARSSDSAGVGADGASIGAVGSCAMEAAVMGSAATHSMTAMPTFTGTCEGTRLMVVATAAHEVSPVVDAGLAQPEAEVMWARGRAPSADSATADPRGAFPHEEDPALAAVVCTAVVCAEAAVDMAAEADTSSSAN